MPKYGTETIPVCEECAALEAKQCAKCGIAYCHHFSSTTDVRFCANCMADFKVVTETEIRTTESVNKDGEVIYRKRDMCKRLKLEGTDWLFTAAKISELTDEELECTIEYHRNIAGMMLSEREERRVEKYQKLNSIVLNLKRKENVDATGAIKGSLLTPKKKAEREADKEAKKVVKTRAKKSSSSEDIVAAMATLLKAQLSPEDLAKFLGGVK